MPEATTVDEIMEEVSSTVEYVREHGLKDMVSGVTSWVKAHPTQALVGALALGFLAAALTRRH